MFTTYLAAWNHARKLYGDTGFIIIPQGVGMERRYVVEDDYISRAEQEDALRQRMRLPDYGYDDIPF